MTLEVDPGSFRDPSGFVFTKQGQIFRQVNHSYRDHYLFLEEAGLFHEFQERGWLIKHHEVAAEHGASEDAWIVIQPERLPFISYPDEWCFSQLKDAALLTLDMQRRALELGASLKDASAFNVQFTTQGPIFIDSLSFEKYKEGAPWIAYGQFCRHFLAPLALAADCDVRLMRLQGQYIDGIPLDIASSLLPWRTKFRPGLAMHLHLHANSIKKNADSRSKALGTRPATPHLPKKRLFNLIDHLRDTVSGLNWAPGGSEWFDYYSSNNNYGEEGLEEKERLLRRFLGKGKAQVLWDIGGNTGRFSRIAASCGYEVLCWDIDPGCVEAAYRIQTKESTLPKVVPLLVDLTQPTAARGWQLTERRSFIERADVDCIMALGLIHHLVITNNVPLPKFFAFLAALGQTVIVEFIPKSDSQVQKLLANRGTDPFGDYTLEGFTAAAAELFDIVQQSLIPKSERSLFRLRRKSI